MRHRQKRLLPFSPVVAVVVDPVDVALAATEVMRVVAVRSQVVVVQAAVADKMNEDHKPDYLNPICDFFYC